MDTKVITLMLVLVALQILRELIVMSLQILREIIGLYRGARDPEDTDDGS